MLINLVTLLFRRTFSLLTLSFLSLTIGGFLFGVVFSFTQSITSYLVEEGKELIGGDIVLSSPYPIDTSAPLFERLRTNGVVFLETRSFQGVFSSPEGGTTAAQIRAVGEGFPHYGEVILAEEQVFTEKPWSLYAEPVFLQRIGLRVGDVVTFAGKEFTIEGELLREPDTLSLGVSFAPKVIVFLDDVATIDVPLNESRTRYRVLLKDGGGRLTEEDRRSLFSYAEERKLRIDDAVDGPNNLLEGFSSVDDFIAIILSVALLLVVINISANLTYLLARYRTTIALLKIYGATNRLLRNLFLVLLGGVGFLAGVLGAYLGTHVGGYVLLYIQQLYAVEIVHSARTSITLLGGLFGLLFIVLTALPFLQLVRQVEPKELLLNTTTLTKIFSLRQVIFYVPTPLFVGGTLYLVSGNLLIATLGVLLCLIVFLMFMFLVHFILKALYNHRKKFSFLLRSVISFLFLRKAQTLVSVAAVMTAFSLVFLVSAVEVNIKNNLRTNITTTAPSLYLVDITRSQLEEVRRIVGNSFREYPIVRGRLLFFNERDLLKEDNRELRREFNLTYRDSLIEGEKLVSGALGDTLSGKVAVPVSIDNSFGDELGGVEIGDTLTIFIQGIEINATITSIREVDSRSGIPFFYLVFPTEVLSKFPATFFGTAQVTDEQRTSIEREVATRFPNIVPIVTSSLIAVVTEAVESIVKVVTLLSIPSITLGLFLILVMLSQNMYERSGDVLVLRAFGLTRKKVIALFVIEGSFLVLLSAVTSYVVAHAIAYVLNLTVFSFSLFSFSFFPFIVTLLCLLLVIIVSLFFARQVTRTSLKRLLAEK